MHLYFMSEYLSLKLEPVELWKLNFEEDSEDVWHDIDSQVKIYKTDKGYQQYVHDENDNHIDVGIPLQTVGDLMKRYNSMTGHELKYWDKDYPQTAQ
jgi:hypothetical protein